ncbi:MAG: hypothetical protein KDJ40_17880 [Hyphomicrobiales bacterium]|nr:hypothetical protein [Hyphomicrobiales bacterium]
MALRSRIWMRNVEAFAGIRNKCVGLILTARAGAPGRAVRDRTIYRFVRASLRLRQ